MTCAGCGIELSALESLANDAAGGDPLCAHCRDERVGSGTVLKRGEISEDPIDKLRREAGKVLVTTTNNIEGYSIDRYIGVESVEYVVGNDLISEGGSRLADFFTTRQLGIERRLSAGKEEAILVLRMKAIQKGANAVIGVSLEYTEFSGQRMAIIASGTLVKATPRKAAH